MEMAIKEKISDKEAIFLEGGGCCSLLLGVISLFTRRFVLLPKFEKERVVEICSRGENSRVPKSGKSLNS